MAIDPKHLQEDPRVLQQMVLDMMAQLDRESTERSKIESLLHELLDAKRNRKSERLSAGQLALFAALWQERQTQAAAAQPDKSNDEDQAARPAPADSRSGEGRAGGSRCRGISSGSESCTIWPSRTSTVPSACRIYG